MFTGKNFPFTYRCRLLVGVIWTKHKVYWVFCTKRSNRRCFLNMKNLKGIFWMFLKHTDPYKSFSLSSRSPRPSKTFSGDTATTSISWIQSRGCIPSSSSSTNQGKPSTSPIFLQSSSWFRNPSRCPTLLTSQNCSGTSKLTSSACICTLQLPSRWIPLMFFEVHCIFKNLLIIKGSFLRFN